MPSSKKKISVIFGTRPEAIKLAPVILELRKRRSIDCRVCVTAQHREMLDQVLDVFDIKPDHDLNLMRKNQTLASFTARALRALDVYLAKEKPGLVLVQGDTTTVFCATLAAFYRHIPVGHVEAGLRTWNLEAPWPEEANRVLTSRLAAIHFAPTEWSRDNLLKEGIPAERIHVTGNTVVDALLIALKKVHAHPPCIPGLPDFLQPEARKDKTQRAKPITDHRSLITGSRIVLITGHRRESFGEGFEQICKAIAQLAGEFPDVHFVYPVHLNPHVRRPVFSLLSDRDNVHLIEPLSYLAFVGLMDRCSLILTDSGGVQEEAPSLGKPVLVMRETTERPEGVEAGTSALVGADAADIVRSTHALLEQEQKPETKAGFANPYGTGRAAAAIVRVLLKEGKIGR